MLNQSIFTLGKKLCMNVPIQSHSHELFFFLLHWVFVAACGLSRCSKWGLLFVAVRGLLIAEHGLQARGLQQWQHLGSVVVAHGPQSAQASIVVAQGLSCSMACGDLPGAGIEPVSPALAGGYLTTAPPGKSGISVILLAFLQMNSTASTPNCCWPRRSRCCTGWFRKRKQHQSSSWQRRSTLPSPALLRQLSRNSR